MNHNISKEEVEKASEILSKLEPGFIPEPIFRELTRIQTSSILEIVPLRLNSEGEVEVLLIERPKDDPVWSGKLHTPGTVLRGNDTLEIAFDRILTQELNINLKKTTKFVTCILHKVARGNELAAVYYIDISGIENINGEFYNSNSLPRNIVETQVEFINQAVQNFKNNA